MHRQFLLEALAQAQLGRGQCAPNPSVGALIVQNNTIIAQSYHRGAGTPHAEQLIVRELPENKEDLTLYVTLEPCNHWGKTPPCVSVIIESGIKKVVFAYRDPNPIVLKNNSTQILSEHGVHVEHYPLPEIDAFYKSYAHWVHTKKPWVTAKIAQSLDGCIAGEHKKRVLISNEKCAEFTHKQRLQTDLILTTALTIAHDNPQLNARIDEKIISKPVAILDRTGQLCSTARIFDTARYCHVYRSQAYLCLPAKTGEPMRELLPERVNLHTMPSDLEGVMCHLGSLGYHDVWVESGPTLFNALHEQSLVNTTYIYMAPIILGIGATPLYHRNIFTRACEVKWHIMGDNVIASLDWMSPNKEHQCLQV